MALTGKGLRAESYGQGREATPVDRFGVWLSSRQIRRHVPDFGGRRVADLGCGYHATFARTQRVGADFWRNDDAVDYFKHLVARRTPRCSAIGFGVAAAARGYRSRVIPSPRVSRNRRAIQC